MKFSFFCHRHALLTSFDIFVVTYIEWLTFCQNLLTCYYFLWKKLNFHFFNPLFSGIVPRVGAMQSANTGNGNRNICLQTLPNKQIGSTGLSVFPATWNLPKRSKMNSPWHFAIISSQHRFSSIQWSANRSWQHCTTFTTFAGDSLTLASVKAYGASTWLKEQMWKARCWSGQPKSEVRVQNTEGAARGVFCTLTLLKGFPWPTPRLPHLFQF